ncbi:MAG: nicotinate-nucleotide adenylyltransferase [Actinomycetota bacterium]
MRVRRVGIFGGTFDPPHVGHLVIAVNVLHELALDEVLLVVANVPWQKTEHRAVTTAQHRLEMIAAAVRHVEGLSASDLEIRRGGPSYTIDTVDELQADGSTRAYVILGSDAAAGLPSWERADELRERARIVVVDRPGAGGSRPPDGWDWINVEAPRLDVSSTDLRQRVRDRRPLDYLIPNSVLDVITTHDLYREAA